MDASLTSGHVATCAKNHVEDHREEGGVKAKYWCHRRE